MSVGGAQDKAFEVFVKRAVTGIMKEGADKNWTRSKEAKDLKDACAAFLTLLDNHEAGVASFDGSLAVAVLQVLSLACANSNPRVVDLALGCLHKLVAHAWLQGESSLFEGLLDDGSDVVSQVIKLTVKCGETSSDETLQLAVIRALLTFTTAEHFVAHGDCLMAAIRTVFNLALGSEAQAIKRTACSALLQMLNTVAKRITCSMLHYGGCSSASSSKRTSEIGDDPAGAYPGALPRQARQSSIAAHAAAVVAALPGGTVSGGDESLFDGLQVVAPAEPPAEMPSDARTAQFASMAEQSDLRGLEAAIEAAASGGERDGGEPPPPALARAGSSSLSPNGSASLGPRRSMEPGGGGGAEGGAGRGSARSPRALQHSPSLSTLTVMERDVLQVLTAFCKLASRESGLTEVESFLHQGKLLSLELLAKVLSNPQHLWDSVRDDFCRHLTQPLCITLLRNCSAADATTFQLAIKLLVTVMLKPRLRRFLKAELGAFYPLYILRPLEAGRADLHTLHTVLGSVKLICNEPQLLVDVFVNYDCDLAAPCLYERTVAALSSLSRMNAAELERAQQVGKQQEQAARVAAVREFALKGLLAVLGCLEAWAAPVREAHARVGGGEDAAAAEPARGGRDGEAERLEAVHQHKSGLAKGLAMFNSSPVKGVRYLLQQGLVPGGATPAAVARFLRSQQAELGKAALGEYFGHHEEFAVAVMHAWIDAQGSWAGLPIDGALRLLLEQFRLPGEAQKIDRIMEKFAERYVRDNPGRFAAPDGAYVLAFAIIMLNTDAHNPLAERRLTKADFVAMNSHAAPPLPPPPPPPAGASADAEGGPAAGGLAVACPALPVAELDGIYDRIVMAEIKLKDEWESAGGARGAGDQGGAGGMTASRLAAALGLRSLAVPFRPVSRGWGRQQPGESEADRKRKLVQLAERAVLTGGGGRGAAGLWHAATSAEHARPMLTVSGGPLLEALTYTLGGTHDVAAAAPLLGAVAAAAELAALLGLEELCEACVDALRKAAGLAAPAPHGSRDEAKQLAALRLLLGLAASPVAGLLGSGWAVLHHTAAALDALTAELAAGAAPPGPSPGSSPPADANPFNKMFAALGFSLAGAAAPAASRASGGGAGAAAAGLLPVPAANGHHVPSHPPALRAGPGAGLALWSLSPEGAESLARLYRCSSTLDGDAVVVYFRALCAVSREELDSSPSPPSPLPRLYSLHRLLDCAHANLHRIRLIRSKLWAITSAHLVMIACQPGPAVAGFAVDALHGLAVRLLAAAGAAGLTQQEEALRPFVAVLRGCDEAEVRRLAIRRALEACSSRLDSLGSGWRVLLELLRLGAEDGDRAVAAEAAGALQVAVDALYRPEGVAGGEAALDPGPPFSSSRDPSVSLSAGPAPAAGSSAGAAAWQRPDAGGSETPPAASSSGGNGGGGGGGSWQPAGGGGRHECFPETLAAVMASARNPRLPASVGLAAVQLVQACGRRLAGHQQRQQQGSGLEADFESCWGLLLECLAGWAVGESRGSVAEAASQAVLELMQAHGAGWGDAAWGLVMQRVLPSLLAPGAGQGQGAGAGAAAGMSEFVSRAGEAFPGLCAQLSVVPERYRGELLERLSETCLAWFTQPDEGLALLGLKCFEMLARQLAQDRHSDSWRRLLGQVSALLRRELEGLMLPGVWAVVQRAQGRPGRGGRGADLRGGAVGVTAAEPGPRLRVRLVLLMQRLLVRLHGECMGGMPWAVQAELAALLVEGAGKLRAFNLLQQRQQEEALGTGLRLLPAPAAAGSWAFSRASSSVPDKAGPAVGGLQVQAYNSERLANSILEASSWAEDGNGKAGVQAGRGNGTEGEADVSGQVGLVEVVAEGGRGEEGRGGLVLVSVESQDRPALALGRLEAEAATGAMAVLEQCAAGEGGAGAEQLLRSFCLDLVAGAAAAAPPGSAGCEAPSADAAAAEAAAPWHCGLRALGAAAAVRCYLRLAQRRGEDPTPALWAHALLLMQSPHALLRHAVADFFITSVAARVEAATQQ